MGFGRMNGRTIGIVGNQPTEAAGKNHLSLPVYGILLVGEQHKNSKGKIAEKCGVGELLSLSPSSIFSLLVLMLLCT